MKVGKKSRISRANRTAYSPKTTNLFKAAVHWFPYSVGGQRSFLGIMRSAEFNGRRIHQKSWLLLPERCVLCLGAALLFELTSTYMCNMMSLTKYRLSAGLEESCFSGKLKKIFTGPSDPEIGVRWKYSTYKRHQDSL